MLSDDGGGIGATTHTCCAQITAVEVALSVNSHWEPATLTAAWEGASPGKGAAAGAPATRCVQLCRSKHSLRLRGVRSLPAVEAMAASAPPARVPSSFKTENGSVLYFERGVLRATCAHSRN